MSEGLPSENNLGNEQSNGKTEPRRKSKIRKISGDIWKKISVNPHLHHKDLRDPKEKFLRRSSSSVDQSILPTKYSVAGEKVTKFDPSFQGPVKHRGCTDVICCLLFVALFIGMLGVGIFAFAKGDPRKLLNPTNSEGNICGMGKFKGKPNLFFFDALECAKVGAAVLAKGCPTPQICVKSCPTKKFTWLLAETDKKYRKDLICKPKTNPETNEKTVKKLIEDEDCAAYYVESSSVVGRCIPSILKKGGKAVESIVTNDNNTVTDKFGNAVNGTRLQNGTKYIGYLLNAADIVMRGYQDVANSWTTILLFLGMSMLVSLLWIIIMRWITGPMVWLSLLAFAGLFGYGTFYCFYKFVTLKGDGKVTDGLGFSTSFSYYSNLPLTWLLLGIIVGIMLAFVLIILIFLRSQIVIAIALIAETSRAVGSMVFILLWPIVPFILQILLFSYWGASAIYLASIGEGQYALANKTQAGDSGVAATQEKINKAIERIPCTPGTNDTEGTVCHFLKYGGEDYTLYLQLYQLFMLFWTTNFVVALGQMVLAGSFASYYWAFNKPHDIPALPVAGSLFRTCRYHVGSIAFGSLIIAIIQLIRTLLEYINSKLKGANNAVAKFCLCCCQCCFWCLESFMKFVNKNAYIMIAIYGKNFCTSAKNAFLLLTRNIARVAVVGKCTSLILLLGKLVVVAIVGGVAGLYFSGKLSDYDQKLNFYFVPIAVVAIGSYVIAAGFFEVYGMGVDTLFLCFLEDLERNDGSVEKPYYMSKELKDILGKKNKSSQKL